ncbi:nitrate transporter [Amylibacter marinus]|uniref:Nitrate transporter n=1 Tax=Amylibacter marinus TaxID=1475483 RepID=A0ABQ5VS69_9RHOB|nr:CmpA/NrtA family ABC transporter substrate-binding protein [Amylibacter marinus]GLQ33977.1 nitrate transporter [Amylibacter marinus]
MIAVLNCSYVPLVDAAPLIVAKELGYAEEEGIHLNLSKETSWSSLRDKLMYGVIDAAHMLAPLAVSLAKQGVIVPQVLSLNGNCFVAGDELAAYLHERAMRFNDAACLGQCLVSRGRVRIGVPFLASMQALLLRYLVRKSGADPDLVLDFVVSPPSLMGAKLQNGEIECFMVGEPWGSLAVAQGLGQIFLTSSAVWQGAPEKVLAISPNVLNMKSSQIFALMRACARAGRWLSENRDPGAVAELLAKPDHLDCAAELLEHSLSGRFILNEQGHYGIDKRALVFGGPEVSFPWVSQSAWIAQEMQIDLAQSHVGFRPDLYRAALESLGGAMPAASSKLEGALCHPRAVSANKDLVLGPDAFFDGQIFDPD